MDKRPVFYQDGRPGTLAEEREWYWRNYGRWDDETQERPAGRTPQNKPVKIQYNLWEQIRRYFHGE